MKIPERLLTVPVSTARQMEPEKRQEATHTTSGTDTFKTHKKTGLFPAPVFSNLTTQFF
jgi:hypothetical protein